MCQQFDSLFESYLNGVKAGALAWNAMQKLDPMDDEYLTQRRAEYKAHTLVKGARALLEHHKQTCPACHHLLTATAPFARQWARVDPAEYEEAPLLAMMEAV